ncbi:MAG: DUF4157 domain-containing protein [Pyrinomonadaceae bacterium]
MSWQTKSQSRQGTPPTAKAAADRAEVLDSRPGAQTLSHSGPGVAFDFSLIPVLSGERAPLRPKLTVSAPGDAYEQEADRVSEQVMRMPKPRLQLTPTRGGACPECQAGKSGHGHERLQMTHVGPGVEGSSAAPSSIHEVLRSAGRPLDAAARTFMEPRFGHDFSRVRIHIDAEAAQSAGQLNASAYTVGDHIVFAEGRFAPSTPEGDRLLAHELTHVLQQNGGMMAIQRGPGDKSPPTSSPANRTAYERYLETLRELMSKPTVTNSTLSGIIEKLYRDNPEVGSGSTAAAIREELSTGMPTKGTFHLQKGQENLKKLAEWLADQKRLEEAF